MTAHAGRAAARRLPQWLLVSACLVGGGACAEPPLRQLTIHPSTFERASEALQDAIENQGLIPGPRNHFGAMLERTGPVLGNATPVYAQAEIVPFCSATVSWLLVKEKPERIALCPLTIAVYTLAGKPDTVYLSYREPGTDSPGLQAATALLDEISAATAVAARIHRPTGN